LVAAECLAVTAAECLVAAECLAVTAAECLAVAAAEYLVPNPMI
jgi:hypothetical protein